MIYRSGYPDPNNNSGGDAQLFMQSQDDLVLMAGEFSKNGSGNDLVLRTNNVAHTTSTTRIRIKGDGTMSFGTDHTPLGLISIYQHGTADTNGIILTSDGSTMTKMYNDGTNFVIKPVSDFIVTGADDFKFQCNDDYDMYADDYAFHNNSSNLVMHLDADGSGDLGLRLFDSGGNHYLSVLETGTSMAKFKAASTSLFFANTSGTSLELTGHQLIETGRTTTSMGATTEGSAANNATDQRGYYRVEALADPGQAGTTRTTVLTLPDGAVGGERYTVTCIAFGEFKPPGTVLTGTCIISGTIFGGTTAGSMLTEITGATAANTGVQQCSMIDFIWHNGDIGAGWMYQKQIC